MDDKSVDELVQVANASTSLAEELGDNPARIFVAWFDGALELDQGPVAVSLDAMWQAFLAWSEAWGIAEVGKSRWKDLVGSRMTIHKIGPWETCLVNLILPAIMHLSRPTIKVRYGLSGRTYRKNVLPFFDYDYFWKLSERDKSWVSKFNEEYYHNRFLNDDTDFHCSKQDKRRCYSTQHERWRDSFAATHAQNKLVYSGDTSSSLQIHRELCASPEDALIELIDLTREET